VSDMLIKQLSAKVRNLFSLGLFQKRHNDGSLRIKTFSGRVLEKTEAFPYGFTAKAKTGMALVLCQGGDFNGFEILPLVPDENTVLSKLEENDAAVYTDNNGNIKIIADGTGKVFIGNDSKNMCDLLSGLIDEVKSLTTAGSVDPQSVSPASQVKLETYKNQIKRLFMESLS
jgi:phage gp45-like